MKLRENELYLGQYATQLPISETKKFLASVTSGVLSNPQFLKIATLLRLCIFARF